jgi:hypothetical protein
MMGFYYIKKIYINIIITILVIYIILLITREIFKFLIFQQFFFEETKTDFSTIYICQILFIYKYRLYFAPLFYIFHNFYLPFKKHLYPYFDLFCTYTFDLNHMYCDIRTRPAHMYIACVGIGPPNFLGFCLNFLCPIILILFYFYY